MEFFRFAVVCFLNSKIGDDLRLSQIEKSRQGKTSHMVWELLRHHVKAIGENGGAGRPLKRTNARSQRLKAISKTSMAKDQERKLAAVMYIEQGKTAKEIAAKLSLSENTLGKWVADGNWKERRTAKITAGDSLIRSYRTLLQTLVDKRQLLETEPAKRPGEDEEQRLERAAERDRDKVRLSDEISKINKALDNAEKENKIPLSTYIKVMESIFDSMQKDCPKIYLQLLDFQEAHINNIAKLHE